MTTLTFPEIPLAMDDAARRLRRAAAAVRIHFTWWGVHKTLSARQREEVGVAYDADARLLTAGKRLIDTRHEAFRKLTSIRSRVVSYWRGLTLPYVEPGIRLIRQVDIESFHHVLEGFREDLAQAEGELETSFEQIKADARQRLGRLYDSSDYPTEVRGLFRVEWDFPSVEPPAYLLRVAPELYRQEQERVAQRFEEAVRLAEEAFLAEFARLVAHLTERLGHDGEGERRVFRDSAVTNLLDFFGRFKNLNLRSSQELDRLVEQAQQLVRGVTPQALRTNEELRQQLANEMGRVQSQVEGLIVDRPRRHIIRAIPMQNGGSDAAGD